MVQARLLHGSKDDDKPTPPELLYELHQEFCFDHDPCPLGGIEFMNGLEEEWGMSNFVNPPYSDISSWIKKGIKEMFKGKLSIFLITARTNTKYWKDYVFPYACEIRYLQRGVKFGNYRISFPIPLVIVVFDPSRIPGYDIVERENYSYAISKEQNLYKTVAQ